MFGGQTIYLAAETYLAA